MTYKLDIQKLKKFVKNHEKEIYCIYAGIKEEWEFTSDEIYLDGFGWFYDACITSDNQTPIAYIHYHDEKSCSKLPDVFKDVIEV